MRVNRIGFFAVPRDSAATPAAAPSDAAINPTSTSIIRVRRTGAPPSGPSCERRYSTSTTATRIGVATRNGRPVARAAISTAMACDAGERYLRVTPTLSSVPPPLDSMLIRFVAFRVGPVARTVQAPAASTFTGRLIAGALRSPLCTVTVTFGPGTLDVPEIRQSRFDTTYCTSAGRAVRTLLRTVTTTSSVDSPPGPVAVTWKVRGPPFLGVVNVGLAVSAPLSVTVVPPVCFQANVVASVEPA